MKKLNYNFLALAILFCALAQPLLGQSVRETNHPELAAFHSIELGGDFALDVQYGKQYAMRLSVEELFADFVMFSVLDSTLAVTLDERRVPAEVRKLFRGKDAATPVFRVFVTMPESLRSLKLDSRAVLLSADDLVVDPERFHLQVTENARVASLAFGSGQVEIEMDRKAEASMSVTCDSLTVVQAGTSRLDITHHSQVSAFDVSGSSALDVKGETGLLKIASKGFSKSILNGKAPVARYKLANSSQVNATLLETSRAFVEMSGLGSLTQAASEELSVDLTGGATVYFLNDPAIHVIYLKNASLIPYDRK
ncbi:MAG: DUF2807 domain-containing protein [Bacteroidales bacterium]|nr:DUF2807 domain-containing protein [Bacteroidales bacterium]